MHAWIRSAAVYVSITNLDVTCITIEPGKLAVLAKQIIHKCRIAWQSWC
jgi:hypothetical protein